VVGGDDDYDHRRSSRGGEGGPLVGSDGGAVGAGGGRGGSGRRCSGTRGGVGVPNQQAFFNTYQLGIIHFEKCIVELFLKFCMDLKAISGINVQFLKIE
jgi:hypothetical protein